MLSIISRKSLGSRITTSTFFTRIQQAFKLKFEPLFCAANESTKTKLIEFSEWKLLF